MPKKHMLLMLACCLVPLAALAAITVFNVPANTVIYFGLLLLCPLMHFAMMRGMGHQHADHDTSGPTAKAQPLAARDKKGLATTSPRPRSCPER